MGPPMPTDRRPPRWGVRTLAFLVLALLCIGISTLQGHYTVLSLTGLLVGLIGAMICSVRGLLTLR
jgi:peptidoglycan/LPS O-acetylase OafA/YrhL